MLAGRLFLCFRDLRVAVWAELMQRGSVWNLNPLRPTTQCPAGTRTRPDTRYFICYPTRFSFENHRVAGNPKYRVLPEISGKPGVSGITRYIG